jgi:hypothetical protein
LRHGEHTTNARKVKHKTHPNCGREDDGNVKWLGSALIARQVLEATGARIDAFARSGKVQGSRLALVINRLSPNEHRGDRLVQLLDNGMDRSSYLCGANAMILAAWLSLPLSFLSIVSMWFGEPRRRTV